VQDVAVAQLGRLRTRVKYTVGLQLIERALTAATVRETAADVSLSFVEIEPEDRLILAQLTFAYHRRRAGQ